MINNILIVDDISMNRKILKNILSSAMDNAKIIEARDGFEAMEILKTQEIMLVILDIMMPHKDGMEVLTDIKTFPELCNIPVIMCSAVHEIESVEKALSLGALDYFTKPLTEEQMRVTIPLKVNNALDYFKQKNEIIKLNNHLKEELLLAKQLQKSLISEHDVYEGVEIWGKYIPCDEIGGDFFSIVKNGNKLWFMIADILGHGVSAAMVSAMMKVIFNNSLMYSSSPDQVLKNINDNIFQIFDGSNNGISSAFVGCIEENRLTVSNAGHPYPIYIKGADKRVENFEVNGMLIGIFKDAVFDSATYSIEKGDCVVLYTDGIFDKGNADGYSNWGIVKDYCNDRINEIEGRHREFLDNMADYFFNLEAAKFVDDVAIMLLCKK